MSPGPGDAEGIEDAALGEELLLGVVPVPGDEGDRKEVERREAIGMPFQDVLTNGPIAVLGDELLRLVRKEVFKVGLRLRL